jgi:hypothetical protein
MVVRMKLADKLFVAHGPMLSVKRLHNDAVSRRDGGGWITLVRGQADRQKRPR